MQVKEIGINTGKIKLYGICKKKYQISFLGGPTTPTYFILLFESVGHEKEEKKCIIMPMYLITKLNKIASKL